MRATWRCHLHHIVVFELRRLSPNPPGLRMTMQAQTRCQGRCRRDDGSSADARQRREESKARRRRRYGDRAAISSASRRLSVRGGSGQLGEKTTDGLWWKTFKRLCAEKMRPASLLAAARPRRMKRR